MPDHNSRRYFLKGAGFAAGSLALPLAGALDVKSFGAKGDGKTPDTAAIDRAIDAAAAAGGGTVFLAAGTYLCYTIHLQSKVALHLDQGATIVAADSPAPGAPAAPGYDLAEPNPWDKYQDFGHSHWRNSLIYGEGLEDISIFGPGLLWGKGLSRGWGAGPKAEQPGVGNKTISLKNCRNVTLRDFSILHGGHFGILATGVDNLTIDNVTIDTNRDGMDIDCCRNVRVSNCSVNSPWDDGICLKSCYGLGFARATEMVTIANCLVSGSFEEGALLDATFRRFPAGTRVPRTGRIKFGTESNGGFINIAVTNCVFDGCQGLAIESVDGAQVEDIAVSNITMRDISSAPIFLRLGRRMRGPADAPVGVMRRVMIGNIVCSNSVSRFGSIVSGVPGHPIENVKIHDVYIQHQGGGTREDAALDPPEKETGYPEPNMFGSMPSHGFFIRHAKGIEVRTVEIETMQPDLRPFAVLRDVDGADFFRIKTPHVAEAPLFSLNNVRHFSVARSKPLADTEIEEAAQKTL
ncbi:MAG: glycoside hydrolase family 28 protein [Bryobacteraceae bacterium]